VPSLALLGAALRLLSCVWSLLLARRVRDWRLTALGLSLGVWALTGGLEAAALMRGDGTGQQLTVALEFVCSILGVAGVALLQQVRVLRSQAVRDMVLDARQVMLAGIASKAPLESLLGTLATKFEEIAPGLQAQFHLLPQEVEASPQQPPHAALAAVSDGLRAMSDDAQGGYGWIEPVASSTSRQLGALEVLIPTGRRPRPMELDLGVQIAQLGGLTAGRIQADQTVERLQALLNATLEESLAGVLVVDAATHTIRIANPAARHLLGPSARELIGLSIEDHYASLQLKSATGQIRSPRDMPLVRSLLLGETCRGEDHRMVRKDGREFWLLVNSAPILDAEGNVEAAMAVFMDVTAKRQAEIEREAILERLRVQNKELEEVFQATSHDLRSPLVNIEGFGREISHSLSDLRALMEQAELDDDLRKRALALIDEEIDESLGYVQDAGKKMDRLLGGLRAVARFRGQAPSMTRVSMLPLIQGIVRELRYQAQAKQASITIGEIPDCYGAENELAQIFTNLIDNALQFLDPERPGVIRISALLTGDEVEYSVTDNGMGIEEQHQSKIFETFRRLNPEGPAEGEGLGLSILSRIVHRHSGNFGVKSVPGEGSTFWVRLPANAPTEAWSE
jgi:PAS domain S-box-containing protein